LIIGDLPQGDIGRAAERHGRSVEIGRDAAKAIDSAAKFCRVSLFAGALRALPQDGSSRWLQEPFSHLPHLSLPFFPERIAQLTFESQAGEVVLRERRKM
jgi:hypothetical protein